MMNIFFLISSVARPHGVERTLIDKMNYLAENGHSVTLVTYEQGPHPVVFPLNEKVVHIDIGCRYFTLFQYSLPRRVIEKRKMKRRFRGEINRLIDQYRPDIIVTPSYTEEFMTDLMSFKTKVHIVIESHTPFSHDMQGGTMLERISKFCYLRTLKQCDLLIALTNGDADCWRKHLKNVKMVPNPVSFYSEDVSAHKLPGRIIAVGRYHQQKRFDRLISAFAMIADRYPSWYIDIYGDGADENILQRQIENEGLAGRIHLHAPTKDILSEYQRIEMFVLSSDYEGFGLVIIEAMACGLPVVSTNCPFGPSEIIEDGVTGLLTKMDVRDLAVKMEWMITHEEERRQMGIRAHQAAARYRKEVVMPQWEHAYLDVIKK